MLAPYQDDLCVSKKGQNIIENLLFENKCYLPEQQCYFVISYTICKPRGIHPGR